MTFLRSMLNILAKSSDDLAEVMAKHSDEFMDAIRAGNGSKFLDDLGDVGARVLRNDDYLRTIGRIGGDAGGLLDNIDDGIRAGRSVSDDIGRLFKGADDIPTSLVSKIDEATKATASTVKQMDDTKGLFSYFTGRAARNADNVAGGAARTADNVATSTARNGSSFFDKTSWKIMRLNMWAGVGAMLAMAGDTAVGNPIGKGLGKLAGSDIPIVSTVAGWLGRGFTHALDAYTFVSGAPGEVAASGVIAYLEAKEKLEDGDQQSRDLIRAAAHGVTGDPIGVVNILTGYGLTGDDLRAAAHVASLEHDNLNDRAVAVLNSLRTTVQERASNNQLGVAGVAATAAAQRIRESNLTAQFTAAASRIKSMDNDGLSAAFNEVVQADNLGWTSSLNMFAAKLFDAIGIDFLANHFKRAVVLNSSMKHFNEAAKLQQSGAQAQRTLSTPEGSTEQPQAPQPRVPTLG